jgi:hypothetical protein
MVEVVGVVLKRYLVLSLVNYKLLVSPSGPK